MNTTMKTIWISYKHEREGWWAESADLPGWTALGASFEEVRGMAREGAREFADEDVLIQEEIPYQTASAGAWALPGQPVISVHSGALLEFRVTVVPGGTRPVRPTIAAKIHADENLAKYREEAHTG